jgi:peptide/nickel transport system substrate-binding protein
LRGLAAPADALRVEGGEGVALYESPRAWAALDLHLFPRHRLAEFSGEEGSRRLQGADLPPVAGPFALRTWTRGEEIVLERNPRFAGRQAALERVRLRFFKSKADLGAAFRAGEVALVPEGVLDPGEAQALAVRVAGAEARVSAAPNWYHLVANLDDPTLADPRVRQALLMAIDREALVRAALEGSGKVAHTWLPPQHEGHFAGVRRWPFDPAQAAALLDAAGLRRAPDGRRRAAGGAPLEIEIARAERHPRAVLEFIIETALAPLGIAARERAHPESVYFREVVGRRAFPHLAFLGYVFDPWESGRDSWAADRVPRAENGWTGKNWSGYRCALVTDLHARIEATLDEDERADLYERQQARWAEDLPCLPLYRTEQALLLGPGLRGPLQHAGGDALLPWNAEEWRFGD